MRSRWFAALMSVVLLGGCATATRQVNPPITQTDPRTGYRFETRQAASTNSKENLVILAFSGGGTRAAAFSYGVLEFLRRTEIAAPNGAKLVIVSICHHRFRRQTSRRWLPCMAIAFELRETLPSSEVREISSPARRIVLLGTLRGGWAGPNWHPSYDESCSTRHLRDLNRGKAFNLASAPTLDGPVSVFNQAVRCHLFGPHAGRCLARAAASSAVPWCSRDHDQEHGAPANWSRPWAKPVLETTTPRDRCTGG